jgi:AraC-like DNA-binding protein
MNVSTVMVRVLIDAVERAGVPREELLRAQAIDPVRLTDADGRFDLEEFALLQMRAMDLTGDEALGFHMADRTPDSAFDLIAHLVSHSPTLREAVGLCTQFQRLLMEDSHLALQEKATTAALHYRFARSFERADRMHAEFVVAGFLRLARVFGGSGVVPKIASFEHPRPTHSHEYIKVFGDVVRFGQSTTALTFDRAVLDRVHLHQHPELFTVLRSHAERALERVAVGLAPAEQVKRYLLARPAAAIPDIATAARDLGLSVRSLRRRLAADATSYRALVQATLEVSAGHLLRDPQHSIQETAGALGFSNVGAFHRAFRRWTGMTPMQYREHRHQRPGRNGKHLAATVRGADRRLRGPNSKESPP